MKRLLAALCVSACVMLGSGPSFAEHMTVAVTDVAHIVSQEGEARVLLKFDAIDLPENSLLLGAQLVLPQSAAPVDAAYEMVIAPISRTWNRAAVTWGSWDHPGGDYVGAHWAHRRSAFSAESRIFTADLRSMVGRWTSGSLEQHGVIIMPHPNTRDGMDEELVNLFYASGGRLEIDYKRTGQSRRARRTG